MGDLERYLRAATRDNTRRSYRAAIEHFEVSWGGFLPATPESVARYLAAHAGQLSINTLKTRLSALAQWHTSQGFADPTRSPLVRQTLKGIRALHPQREKQAEPLQLQDLERVSAHLQEQADSALKADDHAALLRTRRDAALILLGFWRGFRSDELCRLRIEDLRIAPGTGMSLYLPRSKTDRDNLGREYQVPALRRLCPVRACQEWLGCSGLLQGPLFRRIDRWGNLADTPLHANSMITLLRQALQRAGIDAQHYSSHSLRRGFASWATANGWDLKALMEYVGWRDVKSALRYVDPRGQWQGLSLQEAAALPVASEPTVKPVR